MKILYSTIIFIIVLTFTGCASSLPLTTKIVEIPIITRCVPITTITQIAEYPTDNAKKDMTLYEKVQLLVSELYLVKGQNKELQAALIECTK